MMKVANMIVELDELESEYKLRLEEFTAYKEPNSIPDANEYEYNMILNSITLDIVKLSCLLKMKTVKLIELYKEDLHVIERSIEQHQSEQNGKMSRCETKYRPAKKLKSFQGDAQFRDSNGAQSLYFKYKSDACLHSNDDLMSIHQLGYKFLSCLHVPRVWLERECNRLLDAVRNEVNRSHQNELKNLYLRVKLADEPEAACLSVQRANKCVHLSTELSDAIYDVLQSEFANQIDWNRVKKKYFLDRHTPEELQAIWNWVAKPNVRLLNKWTPEEDIMLRRLAIDHNFQNWQLINELMPKARNEFLCFSRYISIFKRKRRHISSRTEENQVFEFGKSLFQDVDVKNRIKARLRRLNSMKGKTKGRFSKREKFVANAYLRRGFSFKAVANILKSRSPEQLRDHYFGLSEHRRFGKWTSQEDKNLLSAVRHWGEQNWGKISEGMHLRTRLQCRKRYTHLLKVRRSYVEELVNKKFESTSDILKDIRNFTRRTRRLKRGKKRKTLDQKLDFYFLLKLKNKAKYKDDTELLSLHALQLLKFLDFDLSSSSTEQAAELNHWLIQYPSSSSVSKLECDKHFKAKFEVVKSVMKTLPLKTVPNVFSPMIVARGKVLPPNKCTLYGLHKFMENFQCFAKKNEEINFEMLWKQQNAKLSQKRYFMESKILWYRVLKMMFFWPLKLKKFLPEDLL